MLRSFYFKFFLLFSLWASCFTAAYSQKYNFRNYTVENGLPSSNIYTILQDRSGYIWMGTADGLCKFDGHSFKNYSKKNGLAENSVTASCQDKKGNIWFGHQAGEITIYYPALDSFKIFNLPKSISPNFLYKIYEDRQANLWFCTIGAGVVKYDGKEARIFSQKNGLANDIVFSVCEDKKGRLWFATNNGVSTYDGKNFQTLSKINSTRSILSDKKGNIWIATLDYGVFVIPHSAIIGNIDTTTIQKNMKSFTMKDGLVSDYTYTLSESSECIWIGTSRNGVSKFIPTDTATYLKGNFKNYTTKNGLVYDAVWTILVDREKNTWLGTLGGGVSQFRYNDERFEIYAKEDGILDNQILAIKQSKDGSLWFGSSKGLTKMNFKSDTISKRNNFSSLNKCGFISDEIHSVFEDDDNTIWAGASGNGLCKLSPHADKFISQSSIVNKLSKGQVQSITQDNQKNIWIGTSKGLIKYNKENDKTQIYTDTNGLKNNVVEAIFKDSRGIIWIATDAGLSKYIGDKITTYDRATGLQYDHIYCLTEDKNKKIWFGTEGGGIYKYDGKTFKNYSTKEGISSENVYSIICDNNNNIWVGTSSGIDKFDQEHQIFKHYGKGDGFLGIDNNLNAICKDKEGNLWFGTVNGAVKYNPKKDIPNATEPLTYINKIQLSFKDIPFPPNNTFSYKQNHLTFHFIGISLSVPEKVRYQFKLEGFDKDWMPVTNETKFTYSNLPPHGYTFMVKSCNNDGVWNEIPTTYSFEITPPFWQTWWFYTLSIVFILSSIYAFVKIRMRNLVKAKEILETQVKERTAEVVKQKEEIELKSEKLGLAYHEIELNRDEIAEKNKDITDSINYAKRIQEAMLPARENLQTIVHDSFIFYRPRDVVSGDFYWFSKIHDYLVIASADCTGHGVPGAFMSLIGMTLIDQIVKDKLINTASGVLSALDTAIKIALKQTDEEQGMRDGMDIALCAINLKKKELQFSGAFRPLYLIRNHELLEYKADKFAIGGYYQGEKIYTNHQFPLQQNDTIYLFSDGCVDQFGGPEGKKFMTKRLKQMLLDIQGSTMQEQEKIIRETIDNWKGKLEQIDDLLIIGLRFN